MMKICDILGFLEEFSPYCHAESWDNVGLLVGDKDASVSKILVALDITDEVILEAKNIGADLIVAHHPVIFGSISKVTMDNLTGKKVINLIKNDISAICMHTNLDCAEGGVNDCLAEKIGLTDIKTLGAGDTGMLGRVGNLESAMPLNEFTKFVKNSLNANGVRFTEGSQNVYRVAVLGGAGGKLMDYAISEGADTYIVGDSSYDIMQRAKELGLNLLDAGHFPTENVIVEKICSVLAEKFPEISVCASEVHEDIIRFI